MVNKVIAEAKRKSSKVIKKKQSAKVLAEKKEARDTTRWVNAKFKKVVVSIPDKKRKRQITAAKAHEFKNILLR